MLAVKHPDHNPKESGNLRHGKDLFDVMRGDNFFVEQSKSIAIKIWTLES